MSDGDLGGALAALGLDFEPDIAAGAPESLAPPRSSTAAAAAAAPAQSFEGSAQHTPPQANAKSVSNSKQARKVPAKPKVARAAKGARSQTPDKARKAKGWFRRR